MAIMNTVVVSQMVALALAEDIGSGDITADLLPADGHAAAEVVTREQGTLCGQAWFEETFRVLDSEARVHWHAPEGATVQAGDPVCMVQGSTRALLTGERVALNFLQTLSGTATRTAAYVRCVTGTGTVILDTRKTLPGWRLAQKYAVAVGGGRNHRLGLYDAILIKENHITATGSIVAAIRAARALHQGLPVEIEVETLDQLTEALEEHPERILLDNFSLEAIRTAVSWTQGTPPLEVSGGISLATVRTFAETGVTYLSVGDLTKNIQALDLSMRVSLLRSKPLVGTPDE